MGVRLMVIVLLFLAFAASALRQPPAGPPEPAPQTLKIHSVPSLGTYAVNITSGLGTYAWQVLPMVLDTSTDLSWVKSEDDNRSDGFPCSDPVCKLIPKPPNMCYPMCGQFPQPNGGMCYANCAFFQEYTYNNGSIFLEGPVKRSSFDTIASPWKDVVYGKAIKGRNVLDGVSGVLGLGRGALSIPSQKSDGRFSYCLPDVGSSLAGFLSLGTPRPLKGMQYVPLNPGSYGYSVSVESAFIGDKMIVIDGAWEQGTKFETATTLTLLDDRAYTPITAALSQAINLPRVDDSSLEFCYKLVGSVGNQSMPTLSIIFTGGAKMDIPPRNYMVSQQPGIMCIAIQKQFYPSNVIGNLFQRNFHFDVQKDKIGFLKLHCVS